MAWTAEGRRKAITRAHAIIRARSTARQTAARELAAQGWTVQRIAHHLGLGQSTIRGYLKAS
jgi:DNA-binding NarL/FixJ family response regulator